METPLINKACLLEKFPDKGGWTFTQVPTIKPDKRNPFGWVKVRGSIDGIEIKQYHLMPMGNGNLFLPVKASIRKQTKKNVGDHVHVVLYKDENAIEIPDEFLDCLRDEPSAHKHFFSFTESEQKAYLDWIYKPKSEATRINKMAEAINQIAKGRKFIIKKSEQ